MNWWIELSRKHKKICKTLNYIEYFLILASTITGCSSIFAFTSLLGISIGITNSAIELRICAITVGINKYKSITKKREKKHNKIVFLPNSKLNWIKVSISKVLIESNICHGELVSTNNVWKEYDEIKEEIENLMT